MSTEEKNIIKINRPPLSTEKVKERENFEGIIDNHRAITKRPVYKQKKVYFILFLILIISYLIYSSEREENKGKEVKDNPKEQTN